MARRLLELDGPLRRFQQIVTCSSADLLAALARYVASGVDARPGFTVADPPWKYSKAAPPKHGRQDMHYGGMTCEAIAADIDAAFDVAADDTYLALWCTMPFVWPFAQAWYQHNDGAGVRWKPLTGGAWGKPGRGTGFHLIGDVEPLFIFAKGNPRPRVTPPSSNLWDAPYWKEERRQHSEKPQAVLADLLKLATTQGDLVLDLYAGETASLARACAQRRRGYVGAELDPKRARKARDLLAAVCG